MAFTMTAVRVLLIDDDPAIRRLFDRGLSQMGFAVTVASDAAEVDTICNSGLLADFVLLDRSLVLSAGANVIELVRTTLPKAKLYYFTGEHVDDDERAKVDGVVHKPLNIKTLADLIHRALV